MYESVKKNISEINGFIKDKNVTLVAATKTVPAEKINFAAENGVSHIGENRVQELLEKYDDINKSVTFHFIGHLQKNKVKYIIDKVSFIHSVDNLPLAAEIDRQAKKHNLTMNILIEVNICREESKSGVLEEDFAQLYEEISKLENVNICGIMAIPKPMCEDIYYQKMYELFKTYKNKNENIKYLSLGMSNDYKKAVDYGSNVIRVGSKIFGERN